jgi:glycerol uptake facilitator-like aquaporin
MAELDFVVSFLRNDLVTQSDVWTGNMTNRTPQNLIWGVTNYAIKEYTILQSFLNNFVCTLGFCLIISLLYSSSNQIETFKVNSFLLRA